MTVIEMELPIKTISEANQSRYEHWGARAKRATSQKGVVKLGLFNYQRTLRKHKGPIIVTLTRIAPRKLDNHDNLPRAFKACVDEIAKTLGVDDKDKRVTWRYAQERGKPKEYKVRVTIDA